MGVTLCIGDGSMLGTLLGKSDDSKVGATEGFALSVIVGPTLRSNDGL